MTETEAQDMIQVPRSLLNEIDKMIEKKMIRIGRNQFIEYAITNRLKDVSIDLVMSEKNLLPEYCKCTQVLPEECYVSTQECVFATPEQKPPFGHETCLVHSQCKKPMRDLDHFLHYWKSKGIEYCPLTEDEFNLL